MKKKILLLLFFVSIFFGNDCLAQTAGDKAPAKTPTSNNENKKGWTSEDRHSFINECIKNAESGVGTDTARFYCYCMQEEIENKFPDAEDANTLSADDLEKPEWQKVAKDCLTSMGHLWLPKYRSEFLAECINGAEAALGKQKATNYCNCMLYKIEKKYPDPNDVDVSEETLASPEWQKMIKTCTEF